jgi:endonuclease III
MTAKERYSKVIKWFEENMPSPQSELIYKDPFQLVVAVILSAQCTDKRVNMITPDLFKRYPDAFSMSRSSSHEIFAFIKSVTYPNNKSKHLVNMAEMLFDKFNGVVPDNTEQLMELPGVGRKTANVIASILYDRPVIAVDTHVFRVSRRLGLSKGKTPVEVEKDLTKNFPEDKRATAHHWLILHGRYVCVARKPKCEDCGLSEFCRYYHESCRTNLKEGSTG